MPSSRPLQAPFCISLLLLFSHCQWCSCSVAFIELAGSNLIVHTSVPAQLRGARPCLTLALRLLDTSCFKRQSESSHIEGSLASQYCTTFRRTRGPFVLFACTHLSALSIHGHTCISPVPVRKRTAVGGLWSTVPAPELPEEERCFLMSQIPSKINGLIFILHRRSGGTGLCFSRMSR